MASVSEVLMLDGVTRAIDPGPRPMMVVDDAHVTYRVYASGKRMSARDSLFSLNALRGGRGLKTVPALRGVSFTASEGETIGVIGHNGSGKSTLFRAMSGLIPTSPGTIWAADRPVLLGVNAALVPELSGENNIKLGLLAMGFTPEEAAAHVDEIADFAELNEFIHHPMRTYSSGMGARLRFAIASAKAHSILLIDEALAVGDRRFKVKSEQRIRGLRDSAGLVMIVSHSASSLRDTCERVLWIHKGELRADGPASEVIGDYVKWTKQPGNAAVGAASTAKSKPRPSPAKAAAPASNAPTSVPMATSVTAPVGGSLAAERERHEMSLFDELLFGADAKKTAADPPRREQTTELLVPPHSTRSAARRERYHQNVRERTRRRIIALVVTGSATLLAIAAGAAIALVSGMPEAPQQRPSATPVASVVTAPPVIRGFTASVATVTCATADDDAEVQLNWEVDDATLVAVAAGAVEVDALDTPLVADLPAIGVAYTVAFPCTDETQTYSLTAENADGDRVSSVVTVTRAPLPEPEPEPAPPVDQPQQPQPEQQPELQPEPQPEPQPEQPVDPQPEPQPEPEPEPEPQPEPEPEPDPGPGPVDPAPDPGLPVVPGSEG